MFVVVLGSLSNESMMYELGQHVSTSTFEVDRGHRVDHQVLVDVAPVNGQPQGKDSQIGQSPHGYSQLPSGRPVDPVTWLYYGIYGYVLYILYVLWFYWFNLINLITCLLF